MLTSFCRSGAAVALGCSLLVGPAACDEAAPDAELRGLPGPFSPSPPVEVPNDHFTPPPELAVLPVFLIPSDQNGAVGDVDLAAENFSAHLQMARRKYQTMLASNGTSRGTFTLASWDEVTQDAHPVQSYEAMVEPLIVDIPDTAMQVNAEYEAGVYDFLAPVLDAAGCVQATCPFVFAVSIVGDPLAAEGARKLNHGLSNGGGVAFFNYDAGPLGISEPGATTTFQSTLLHELGHAFGLPHIFDYCEGGGCPATHARWTSSSIMAYTLANQIAGCGYPNPSGDPCEYPTDAIVDAMPGTLMAEDIRVLDHNDRGFPDLDWVIAWDGDVSYRGSSEGKMSIAGQTTVDLTSSDTRTNGKPPTMLIGDKGQPMLEYFEAFDPIRLWRSKFVGDGQWATIRISLPDTLDLRRIDVYSGYASGSEVMTGVRLRRGRVTLATKLFGGPTANTNLTFEGGTLGSTFDLAVRAGAGGTVALRSLRLVGRVDGEDVEIYPAIEPTVVAATAGTWDGELAAVVGSKQRVRAYSESFDPNSSWHSNAVAPGAWISVDVEFAEPTVLGNVKVHTGHSGQYHAARSVQIERECACTVSLSGQRDECGPASGVACASGGPTVFEWVTTEASSPDELVSFPAREARRWRIAMRTPTAAEQPVTPGYLLIRGLRFFTPAGLELAPARVVAAGI